MGGELGRLIVVRVAVALVLLSLASPAHALPVSYDFTASDGSHTASGSLTYDAESDTATLTSFVAPFGDLSAFDWTTAELWPQAPDKFPVVYIGLLLHRDSGSLAHMSITADVTYVLLDISAYTKGCPFGTPLRDCPPESLPRDDGIFVYGVELVPEPGVFGALAAMTLLAIATRRLR